MISENRDEVGTLKEISVVAGPNRLTVYAFNSDNVKSKDANLVLNGADCETGRTRKSIGLERK